MRNLCLAVLLACALITGYGCGKAPQAADAATVPTDGTGTNGTADGSTAGNAPAPFSSKNAGAQPTQLASATTPKLTQRPSAAPSVEPVTLPSGTPVEVRLNSSISSATAHAGDRFEAVLDSPIEYQGKKVIPAGATVAGRVVAAAKSGRLEHPGMLQLTLASVVVDGKSLPLETSSVVEKGASHKKRNLSWIGGGAAGGALLGGLLGGGKGALIGGAAGAGAGTATAAATGKHDVAFNVERRLTFRLREPLRVQ